MPELPEVETLCRQLRAKVCGKEIMRCNVYDVKLAGVKNIVHKKITGVMRRGKTICLCLHHMKDIVIHLRMSGRLYWQSESTQPDYCRWALSFADGNLYLIDPRRFATVSIEKRRSEDIDNDLLIKFDQGKFFCRHARRKINVKQLLMDSNAIAGIGNIYASEILHSASISPWRQAASLSSEEWKILFDSARKILVKGITCRGTSISDWRDLHGFQGEYQNELKVYGREGKPCSSCRGNIVRIKQGGRSTFYCPSCQK